MENKNYNSILNLLYGLNPKIEPELSQSEIDRKLIKKTLPNLVWKKEKHKSIVSDYEYETDVIDFKSFLKEIKEIYPKYNFVENISKYKDFTFYEIKVNNVFKSYEFEDIIISFYEDCIADLIRTFNEIKENDIIPIDVYKGIIHNDNIEIGIYMNRDKSIIKEIDKNKFLNYSLNLDGKNINIEIKKASKTYKTLFNELHSRYIYMISFNNIFSNKSQDILTFTEKLEVALNLKLYYDYQDMIEFSKNIPKYNNPSISDLFYVKSEKKQII